MWVNTHTRNCHLDVAWYHNHIDRKSSIKVLTHPEYWKTLLQWVQHCRMHTDAQTVNTLLKSYCTRCKMQNRGWQHILTWYTGIWSPKTGTQWTDTTIKNSKSVAHNQNSEAWELCMLHAWSPHWIAFQRGGEERKKKKKSLFLVTWSTLFFLSALKLFYPLAKKKKKKKTKKKVWLSRQHMGHGGGGGSEGIFHTILFCSEISLPQWPVRYN